MSSLKDRLKRIQEQKTNNSIIDRKEKIKNNNEQIPLDLLKHGWKHNGFNVLKREVTVSSSLKLVKKLPEALPILVPDLAIQQLPKISDFLFFDLETTGLSGGGGTVAFLAAFGRFVSSKLHITQYLLLDYSGQDSFLENIISEINKEKSIVVSYNGKCFDSQILNTMCIMNRIKPPVYKHVDLLHPSRRLWKNIIHDCSQGSIETNILNIDRTDDIPGIFAPEIWFDFLKTQNTDRLKGICDHNKYDISGLSEILYAIISIANDPFCDKYKYDSQRIALFWRKFCKTNQNEYLKTTGEKLLFYAAKSNNPKAVYWYSYDQYKNGNYKESLKYCKKGLSLFDVDSDWYLKLFRRKNRLEKYLDLR